MKLLTSSDFKITSCQATLFTPDGGLTTSRFLRDLFPKWTGRFNADPSVLPLPPDIPPEVPRIILSSSDTTWRCEIAPARINLFCRKTSEEGPYPDIGAFFAEVQTLFQQYAEVSQERIARLASVISRIAQHENPGLLIARHFCKERWDVAPFNRPENFELHAHKKYSLGGQFQVNSWVRNKTGMWTGGKEVQPIVVVEQDINTLAESSPTQTFGIDEFKKFFLLTAIEFDSIMALYYPSEAPVV